METLADKIIGFNRALDFTETLPEGIRIMNPFRENETIMEVSSAFYRKYYSDHAPRHLILGINPGRFGSGLTGIPFTDPKHVTANCGIPYSGPMAHEPSSVFVYEMIRAFGGEEAFYHRFYIGAVCPLGFTKLLPTLTSTLSQNLSSSEGHESVFLGNQPAKIREINYNYYDSRELKHAVYDFMVESLKTQLAFGINTDICFCFGTGKNEKFLRELNNRFHFFNRIVALEHPRYIMQYKAKTKQAYIDKYIRAFGEIE
jgi:hypothetical protein